MSMSWAGVAPAAWRQSVLTLAVMACTLALLGVIWSLAGLPLGRTYLRTVCPKKSKPCASGVMIVLWGESRTPRAAKKALTAGRTVCSTTSRALAVTIKSSAHRT